MQNPFVQEILDGQDKSVNNERFECVKKFGYESLVEVTKPFYNETAKALMCPAYWDGVSCWPGTAPNTTVSLRCPSYITGFLPMNNATRQCTENATWFIDDSQNKTWTNYSNCYNDSKIKIFVNFENKSNISTLLQNYTPLIKTISDTGYTASLITLIIAFIIMLLIKKLHCARNKLHMHLFASFILRAFIFLLKDVLFIDGIGLPSDIDYQNGSVYFSIDSETNNWSCKLITSLWEYFITANYSWILMEGLYLHNLIFRALFVDSKNIVSYIIMGWGLPLIVVVPWIIARLLFEDKYCWTTHDDYKLYLVIGIPTMSSILINFGFFIRISMALYSKLRSPINEDNRRYRKWAKSTFVLVPLFGVHYAIFLGLYYIIQTNKVAELIWLICDRLFASFQGCFVAILYCFLNGEVKTELKPYITNFLTSLATNKYFRYCFPCREKYVRSAGGRTSVCTTLSCSSLYMNGNIHRNNKCKLYMIPKANQCNGLEQDHICENGTKGCHGIFTRKNSASQNRYTQNGGHRFSQPNYSENIPPIETSLCMEQKLKEYNSYPQIREENLRMINHEL